MINGLLDFFFFFWFFFFLQYKIPTNTHHFESSDILKGSMCSALEIKLCLHSGFLTKRLKAYRTCWMLFLLHKTFAEQIFVRIKNAHCSHPVCLQAVFFFLAFVSVLLHFLDTYFPPTVEWNRVKPRFFAKPDANHAQTMNCAVFLGQQNSTEYL